MRSISRAVRRRGTAVGAVAAATVLVTSGIAVADNINDNIEDNGTGVTLTAGSTTGGVAKIKLVSTGGDGDPQCNIDANEAPLKLDIVTPAGVTASPDPLSITACDQFFEVTFTAGVNAVSGTATAAILSEPAGGGTYNNNVSIPITVAQPASTNTAPQVGVTGVTDGATYRVGSVPSPGCSVTDAEDTDESATPQVSNGAYDALGQHTVTCSYTDGGQLTRSASATYTVIRALDTTAPIITHTLTPVDGGNGWHTGTVELDWTVTEDESSETLTTDGCDDVVVTTDQLATGYTCSASSEGGDSSVGPITIKRDGTAPTVNYGRVVSGAVGSNGWYTSPVTVEFDATDAFSGVSPSSKQVTSAAQGASVTVASPAFTDAAGNERAAGSVSSPAFKIDTEGPTGIQFTGLPTTPVYFGDAAPTVDCTATDAVSDVADCTVTGVQTAVGTHTLTATATDNAGNFSTATTKYTVLPWTTNGFFAPVDMSTGTSIVYNTVKGGSTVPLKFELFAGATELTDISAIKGFTTTKVNCTSGVEDAIETLATTGGTSLRYDTTAGQFIQNWKTPTGTACYKATMTAQDGSAISAYFKTK